MGTPEETFDGDEIEIWDGALALAQALDHLVEHTCDRNRIAEELETCGADAERVLCSLVESGLFCEVWTTVNGVSKRELALTRAGRLVIIHATSIL